MLIFEHILYSWQNAEVVKNRQKLLKYNIILVYKKPANLHRKQNKCNIKNREIIPSKMVL